MFEKYKAIRDIAYPANKREYGGKLLYSLLCRSVSTIIALMCIKIRLSPNSITMISLLCGGSGIYCLLFGDFKTGATLVAVGYFLDYVDGEVARLTNRTSSIGGFLEALNSNMHYLFVVPAVACGLLKSYSISVETLFISFVASGIFVSIRGVYNRSVALAGKESFFTKIIYCQFKKSTAIRQENPLGAFVYYTRYNLLAQNGIMYPALIFISWYKSALLTYYVKYFIVMYGVFSLITFLGVLLFPVPERVGEK